jgi:hypothetical protein
MATNTAAKASPSPRPAPVATESAKRTRNVKDGPSYRLRAALRAHIRKTTGFAPSTSQVTIESLLAYARALKMAIPAGCDPTGDEEVEGTEE